MTTQINSSTNGTPAPTLTTEPPRATARFTSPAGVGWLVTIPAPSVNELLERLTKVEAVLLRDGWMPAADRPASKASQGDNGSPPVCPEHGKPMKSGRSGWYCPVEVGRHPQNNKPLYCQHTVKGGA